MKSEIMDRRVNTSSAGSDVLLDFAIMLPAVVGLSPDGTRRPLLRLSLFAIL